MKRWYRLFAIAFAFCASFFAVGNASWLIKDVNSKDIDSTTEYTISLFNVEDAPTLSSSTTTDLTISRTSKKTNKSTKEITYESSEDAYNQAITNYKAYLQITGNRTAGHTSAGDMIEATTAPTKATTREIVGDNPQIIKISSYSFNSLFHWAWSDTTYTYDSYQYNGTLTTYTESTSVVKTQKAGTYKVKSNTTIDQPELTYQNGSNTYYLDGYYEGNNGSYDFSKPFDFTQNITSDKEIYARWIKLTPNGGLSNYINGVTSGTKNVYNGSKADYNVSNDSSYIGSLKSVSLNTCTVNSGATINFDMNNGDTDENARDGEDTSANFGQNSMILIKENLDYQVVLNGDLTVAGTLVIGGLTGLGQNGNNISSQMDGLIIGSYVQIDLNGHNLIIKNGGTVHSFGNIIDSKGTGKVSVEVGGTFKTPLVIYGLKGGNSTIWGYGKGICPFENYNIPYIQAKLELLQNSSSSGNLVVFTKMDLGSLGVFNMYIPYYGGNNSYFFQMSGKTNDAKLVITRSIIQDLKKLNNSYISGYRLDTKTNLDFYNTNVVTNHISCKSKVNLAGIVNQSFDLYFDRMIFPISTVYNMTFHSSTWTISQKFILSVGSSITMDKNSELIMDFVKDASAKAINTTWSEISVNYAIVIKTIPSSSEYLSGWLMAVDYPIITTELSPNYFSSGGYFNINSNTYLEYWKRYKKATVNIYGNVRFVSGNKTPYVLSGNINLNTFSINTGNKVQFSTSNMNSSALSGIQLRTNSLSVTDSFFTWFDGNPLTGASTERKNNRPSYCKASRWVSMYLTSNSVSYAIDTSRTSNKFLYGNYNQKTGEFSANTNSQYILLTSTDFLYQRTEDKNGWISSYYTNGTYDQQIDYTQTLTECQTNNSAPQYFTASSKKYIYYGGLFLQITNETNLSASSPTVTCNAQKFCYRYGKETALSSETFKWIAKNNGGYWQHSGSWPTV